MSVEMKPGVWLRRGDRLAVAVQLNSDADYCRWRGSDGKSRFDDGRYYTGHDSEWDLVEWLEVPDKPVQPPQSQPDAAEELAALRDDRDKWHSRAVLAESQVATLGRQVSDLLAQLAEATQERYTQTAQIGHLETINSTHAETIAGLHSEIHGLNMEIGELKALSDASWWRRAFWR